MKKVGVLIAALILVAGICYTAFAVDAQLQVRAKPRPRIIIETDVSVVDFGELDPDTPTVLSNAVRVRVRSNKFFDLSYTATDFSDGVNTMAIGNLEYADAGSGVWTTFTNGPVYLATDQSRGNHWYPYDFRLTIPWDVDPDSTYTATITYTAVQK